MDYGFNTSGDDGSVERNPISYNYAVMLYSFSPTEVLIELKGWDALHNEKVADLLLKGNEKVKTDYINDENDDYDYSVKKAFSDNFERLIHYADIYNGLVQ